MSEAAVVHFSLEHAVRVDPQTLEALNHHNLALGEHFLHTNLIASQCACLVAHAVPPIPKMPPKSTPDGGICFACGGLTVRTGSCTTCTECGTSSGCG